MLVRAHKLSFDDDLGFGLRAGVDVPIGHGGSWIVSAGLRYLKAILESDGTGEDLDLDPLMVSIGVGYRFR